MKCDRCKKVVERVTEVLWAHGPNGNRRYRLCDRCLAEVKKDNLKKMSWSGGIAEWIENDTQQQINLFEGE